jgi:protein TonB
MEVAMLRPIVLFANFIVLPAGLLASQVGTSQSPVGGFQHSPAAAVAPAHASLVLEWDRAIAVLRRGLKEHWATRDQYLTAFEKTPRTDLAGRSVTDAKRYVECEIGEHLPTHEVWNEKWDEGSPINVEVQRTIDELIERREGQATAFPPTSCAAPVPRKVVVAAGVAASMLKTKIDPVNPPLVGSFPITGIVVLRATISTKGAVEALTVLSGPAALQHAALDAVRHWTYRPYLLNNTPVEVETTINVVFMPNR